MNEAAQIASFLICGDSQLYKSAYLQLIYEKLLRS